jgi:hypothetical protein
MILISYMELSYRKRKIYVYQIFIEKVFIGYRSYEQRPT